MGSCRDGYAHHQWAAGSKTFYCVRCGEVATGEARDYARQLLGATTKGATRSSELERRVAAERAATRSKVRADARLRGPVPDPADVRVNTSGARALFYAEWWATFGPRCLYCGCELADPSLVVLLDDAARDEYRDRTDYPTLDHLIPSSLGGRTIRSNLVVACKSCNRDKADGTEHVVRSVQALWRALARMEDRAYRAEEYIVHLKAELAELGADIEPSTERRIPPSSGTIGVCRCGLVHSPGRPMYHARRGYRSQELDLVELGRRAEGTIAGENLGQARVRRAKIEQRAEAASARARRRAAGLTPEKPHYPPRSRR